MAADPPPSSSDPEPSSSDPETSSSDPETASSDIVLTEFAAPTALPSTLARALAFSSIIVAAGCGGIMGFAIVDLSCPDGCQPLALLGGIGGALVTSVGTAIIAVLVLRAMAEWEDQASVRAR